MLLLEEFLEICKQLNKSGITPCLMGSVGLGYISGIDWKPSDIDIHVPGDPRGWDAPDDLRIYDWEQIYSSMLVLGYELIDLHEHEFQKADIHVEFGSITSLYDFAGIREDEIEIVEINQARFRVPNLAQFLKIYQASSQDSYRNENNNDKDFEKISWLESKTNPGL
ncbi:MAG: phosphoribosylanthranilate isomerase [Eubacteriales bacterium]|nr:phosphoribosylanthranilate isomerase [Eubacteriales bacterium]